MSETVTIGGRKFRIGATYAPRRRPSCAPWRKLICFVENVEWPYVVYEARNGVQRKHLGPKGWTDWAGDEVQP